MEVAAGTARHVITVDCLHCGHQGEIAESRLPDYGLPADASLVLVTRLLTCVECGSSAVRAQRIVQHAEV